jgi:ribosomal-protein-serine acetyltransferase
MTVYLEKCVARFDQGVEFSFVMRWQGALVGRIGLQYINMLDRNASLGYWLTKDAEGHGIVTKCCRWLITHGFKTMQLHRIALEAATENVRSLAIPKKLGFTQDGVLREADYVDGRFLDIAVFSLLNREWTLFT